MLLTSQHFLFHNYHESDFLFCIFGEMYSSAMKTNYLTRECKAYSRAISFRGKEWRKDILSDLFRNLASVITHFDMNPFF